MAAGIWAFAKALARAVLSMASMPSPAVSMIRPRKSTIIGRITDYAALAEHFRPEGAGGFVVGKWSGDPDIDGKLAELGVTVRCLPHEQSRTEGRCLVTGKPATLDAVYAKAY